MDAERGLLSSFLQAASDLGDELVAHTTPEQFHHPGHRIIFEQLRAMYLDRKPIDLTTVTEHTRQAGVLERIGGAAYLTDLQLAIPSVHNWRSYADYVLDAYTRRTLMAIAMELRERACEPEKLNELLQDGIAQMLDLAAVQNREETVHHVRKYAMEAYMEIEYAYRNRGRTVGFPTGYADLDRMIGGWQKGYTYYIGARPAMGKTSIGLNFAIEVAAQGLAEGAPVLMFSIEMTGVQLAKRLICTLAEINQQRCRDGFLSQERDFANLQRAANTIANSRLHIDETAALTIADFRARCRSFVKKIRREAGARKDGKPDALIVVDYLQRMKGSSKRSEDARYLELQEIAQGISQTAKELQVPIIILAQLKRPKDKRPDTEPDMTEFRECGDIEQEAHVVALLHRPHYYVKHSLEKQEGLVADMLERFQKEAKFAGKNPDAIRFDIEDLKRYAKLIIDKQREGPVGPIDLRFIADYTKFETWDAERQRYSNSSAQRQVTEGQLEEDATND